MLILKDRLKLLARLARFKNPAELAQKAGMNDATMRQHMARNSMPYDKAVMYADAVALQGVSASTDWIREGKGPAPVVGNNTTRYAKSINTSPEMSHIVHSGGSIEGSDPQRVFFAGSIKSYDASEIPGGLMNLHWSRPTNVPGRPTWSESSNDFTLFVHTDVMAPAIDRGDRILINTVSAPVVGDLVLLMQDEANGDRKVAIRRLMGISDASYRCSQLHPAKTENFPRELWKTIHKVQGIRKK